ncbi:MAG: hypothetical protein DSY77_09125 [Bacteroidetes bacterium]|nr:MAG: hypothetical protein DSY77_09125 [Bacteroidota bacterium]
MHIFTSPNNFSKVSSILFSLLIVLIFQTGFALAQDAPFITVWQTDNPGTSEDNQITIPGTGTDYLIEWEEVGNEANNNGSETGTDEYTITFPSVGTYRVKISGSFNRIEFDTQGDQDKIREIEQWGDIGWSSFSDAFNGCTYLTMSAVDTPDLSNVTNMAQMFARARSFNGDISNWDVSNITNMYETFYRCDIFNIDIGNWDVSSVTNMVGMFVGASRFNQDISNWNVSKVTDMRSMFSGAREFNQNLNTWDVSNVTDMRAMFFNAETFNKDLNIWDVSSVTDMGDMFGGASSFNGDIREWDVSNVTSMRAMFSEATSFNNDLSNWDVSQVNAMQVMFNAASSFDQNLGSWEITNVTSMTRMLDYSDLSTINFDKTLIGWAEQNNAPDSINLGAEGLTYCTASSARSQLILDNGWTIEGDSPDCGPAFTTIWKTDNEGGSNDNQIALPLTGTDYNIYWEEIGDTQNTGEEIGNNTHLVTFAHAGTYRVRVEGDISHINLSLSDDNLKLLELENWGYAEWSTMNGAFAGAENLRITAIDAPDLSQVTDMSRMFYNAKSLNQDISHWDVSNVTNLSDVFHGASSFNQDLSNWDISNVTKMTRMFANTAAFNQDLNNWNTANVKEMDFMFWDADAFQGNISDWNTENVTNMWGMFYGADSFNTDISTWNVSAVTNMTEMLHLHSIKI